MAQSRFQSIRRFWPLSLACVALACEGSALRQEDSQVAVRINGQPLTAQYLHSAREELSSYAQERFSGAQGDRAFLAAMVDLQLLAMEARQSGAFLDPRSEWTVVDTLAQRMARRVKERGLPRQRFAQRDAELAAFVQAHPDTMRHPQRRRAELVLVEDWTAGEALFERREELSHGSLDMSRVSTKLLTRDDASYPVFHRLLFSPELKEGQWLPAPVPFAGKVGVARLLDIEPSRPFDLENPEDRAKVVQAAIQAPQAEVLEAYLAQLRDRWPLKRRLR